MDTFLGYSVQRRLIEVLAPLPLLNYTIVSLARCHTVYTMNVVLWIKGHTIKRLPLG